MPGSEISGRIISAEDMGPLPGAIVVMKDRDTGVVTDLLGNFTFPVEEDATRTLIASYIGMKTGEYQVTEGTKAELVMQPDRSSMDEMVLVAHPDGSTSLPAGSQFAVSKASEHTGASYVPARPARGYDAYETYIRQNMQYPGGDTVGKRAVVILSFTVTSDGQIREMMPLRTDGEQFTEEAIRLLKEGPEWDPASDETGVIDETVLIRILFSK